MPSYAWRENWALQVKSDGNKRVSWSFFFFWEGGFEPWPWLLLAEPETLGHAGMSMFPNLGVSDVGKSIELVTATLWDLDLPVLYKGLDNLSICTHGFGVIGCIFFRPFLEKHMFLRNLGSTPLRESYLCDQGFLMLFLCHFQDWLSIVWFLDLTMSVPKPEAPEVPGTKRESKHRVFDQTSSGVDAGTFLF